MLRLRWRTTGSGDLRCEQQSSHANVGFTGPAAELVGEVSPLWRMRRRESNSKMLWEAFVGRRDLGNAFLGLRVLKLLTAEVAEEGRGGRRERRCIFSVQCRLCTVRPIFPRVWRRRFAISLPDTRTYKVCISILILTEEAVDIWRQRRSLQKRRGRRRERKSVRGTTSLLRRRKGSWE